MIAHDDAIASPADSINALAGDCGQAAGDDDTSTLFWAVLAVLFALCIFYFCFILRTVEDFMRIGARCFAYRQNKVSPILYPWTLTGNYNSGTIYNGR